MSDTIDAGLVLKTAMAVRSIRQSELSFRIRIGVTRISNIVRGYPPAARPEEREKIAEALGFDVDVLFPQDGPDELRRSLASILEITQQHL